jgi:hypothetical protein
MFLLSKWYLDCVSDSGAAVAVHCASLRWGVVRLHYGAALVRSSSGRQAARYTLRPGAAPAHRPHAIEWTCPRLNVDGRWTPSAKPVSRTLIERADGFIRWECLSPRADAVVTVGAETVRGTGYVERLTMTLPPWRLPMDTLRWGRFHAPGWTLVWIDWRGEARRTWVFANGRERSDATLEPHAITLPDDNCRLPLSGGTVLRSGRLLRTALRPLRPLAAVLPHWRGAHETKWLAQATLAGPGVSAPGWLIHEEVRWS